MFIGIKKHLSHFLGRNAVARNLAVFDDDVFIVSYPKSGNTWLRFLIGNLIYSETEVTFSNIEKKVPDIYYLTRRNARKIPKPRYLKSHEYYDPRYKKVIYIVRDPRDVAVSYYNFCIKFGYFDETHSIDEFVLDYCDGRIGDGCSWQQHVGSWLGAMRNDRRFLFIKYEDLLIDTQHCLENIACFLEKPVNDEQLSRVVMSSTAKRMRELEEQQSDVWAPTKHSRRNKVFIRKARSGVWRDELSSENASIIENRFQRMMRKIGYL